MKAYPNIEITTDCDLKVSVIVSAYNVGSFLNKCLSSIARQTMDSRDFEVIVVNDGSTDGSCEIIEFYLERYDNFNLINQPNSGVSSTRNRGIEVAKGEYIVFVDGDDFLEPSYLQELYDLCIKTGADISYCGYYKYFPRRNMKFFVPFMPRTKVQDKEKALRSIIKDIFMRSFPWNKIYKRSLFLENGISFPDMYFEDIATMYKTFYYANKIAVLRKPLYNYTKHKSSMLSTMNVPKINDYINAYGEIRNFLEQHGEFENYRTSMLYEASRCKLCNYYSIIRIHWLARNFEGIIKNFKNSNKSLNYFSGDEFECSNDKQYLPYPVENPKQKRKNKKSNFVSQHGEKIYERQNIR